LHQKPAAAVDPKRNDIGNTRAPHRTAETVSLFIACIMVQKELAPSVLSWTHGTRPPCVCCDLLAFEHFHGRNEQMNTSQ
jgi:hypothetical protein